MKKIEDDRQVRQMLSPEEVQFKLCCSSDRQLAFPILFILLFPGLNCLYISVLIMWLVEKGTIVSLFQHRGLLFLVSWIRWPFTMEDTWILVDDCELEILYLHRIGVVAWCSEPYWIGRQSYMMSVRRWSWTFSNSIFRCLYSINTLQNQVEGITGCQKAFQHTKYYHGGQHVPQYLFCNVCHTWIILWL